MGNDEILSAIKGLGETPDAFTLANRGRRGEREIHREHEIATSMTDLNIAIREDSNVQRALSKGVARYGKNFDYSTPGVSRNLYAIPILPESGDGDASLLLNGQGFVVRYKVGSEFRIIERPTTVKDWAYSGVFGNDPKGEPFTQESLHGYLLDRIRTLSS
jgi:hypothetical protein